MTESIENVQEKILPGLFGNFRLHTIRVLNKINLQYILYFTAFLTFGIGDGFTGAYMMGKLGTGIELNPVARQIFTTHGFLAVIAAKLWLTLMIIFTTYYLQTKVRKKTYWTVNGFLIALTAGGLMAMNANLAVIAGTILQAPFDIIFLYLSMVLIFPELGSIVDKWTDSRETIIKNRGVSLRSSERILMPEAHDIYLDNSSNKTKRRYET